MDVASVKGKVRPSETVKMTATVLSIDMGSREVLLIDTQGKLHTVNVQRCQCVVLQLDFDPSRLRRWRAEYAHRCPER